MTSVSSGPTGSVATSARPVRVTIERASGKRASDASTAEYFADATDDASQAIEWTMTWRDPEKNERRLDRGAEWFLIRDGRIAEVRAYHHGGKKNPQGDLLGFDHKRRGYRMLEDWQAPAQSESAG